MAEGFIFKKEGRSWRERRGEGGRDGSNFLDERGEEDAPSFYPVIGRS